eukprot:1699334-Prymnesium_polylepis.1
MVVPRVAVLLLCIASAFAQHAAPDVSHMMCKDLMDDCVERVGPNKEGCKMENDPTLLNMHDCPLSCDACQRSDGVLGEVSGLLVRSAAIAVACGYGVCVRARSPSLGTVRSAAAAWPVWRGGHGGRATRDARRRREPQWRARYA